MEFLPIEHQYLLSIGFGFLLASYLHEGSHWFVGWLGNSNPKIIWKYGFPVGVDHGNLEIIDPMIIRLSGLSIFIWIPPGVLALGNLILSPSPAAAFTVAVPTFIVLMTSESDVVALRNPEKFREMWLNDDFEGNGVFVPI